MSLAWVAEQIRAVREASGELGPNLIRFNPNPPGMVRPGSATDAVLAHLREHSGRFFTEMEITKAIGRSHAATSWGLLYLSRQGLIESVADSRRNPRYRRYRVQKNTGAQQP